MSLLSKTMSDAVVFAGANKAFVGMDHHEELTLGEALSKKLRSAAKNGGLWYEGDGSDVPYASSVFGGKSEYDGSWDEDIVARNVRGYPIEFLSGMFSNTKENGMVQHFLSPEMSIFDSLLKKQAGKRYFKSRAFDKNTLTAFLREGSEKGKDFIEMAKKPATKQHLDAFFSAGEALMWPTNWDAYPNKFGKLAKKFEYARNKAILDEKSGVFVVGRDHLDELRNIKGAT